mmetsp:Transcript_21593/g.39637  ORF Transcript_21593/g.39637 Transcript_21593/m.39637 type:complete len:94 (+) Transcript_21593:282-563(+)
MVTLAHDGLGRMKLDGRCELELSELESKMNERDEDNDNDQKRGARANEKEDDVREKVSTTTVVTGYKKHLRLRTLPPQLVSPRTVRMCYNDTT